MYNQLNHLDLMLASDWSWNATWYLKDDLKNTVLVWKKKNVSMIPE